MTACIHHMRAYLVDGPARTEMPLALIYRANDPYAVMVTVGTERIEWFFNRDLLRAGTTEPSGIGDVCLWPGGEAPDDRLFLYLCVPWGQALLELRRGGVVEFLAETETVMATGTEGLALLLDVELQALLESEAN